MLDAMTSFDESGVKTKEELPVEMGSRVRGFLDEFDGGVRWGWRVEVRVRIRFGFS